MAKKTSRIPRSINQFSIYIVNTDDYQLSGGNYVRWIWTPAESGAWTAFRTQWVPLYNRYSDKKAGRTTDIKDQLNQIIRNCIKYEQEHHLLD